MSKLDFKSNDTISIGVEIELQLIDHDTRNLKTMAIDAIKLSKIQENAQHIKSELFQSMIEIDTHICKDAIEAGVSLRNSLGTLNRVADQLGVKVLMSGTHPFARYAERLLTPDSRYYKLMDRNQWIARRLQIFGLHVHLGMRDGDHAIAMNNVLSHYLPIILAISASSPFYQGEDTGLASSRITFFEAIPTGGHPYLLNDWKDFETLVEKLLISKSITSLKDLWWDIRPNIEYGTIEVRIADCPPTIKEVEALVALIHALAVFADKELKRGRRFSPPPEWILRENKWRASRYGTDCDLIWNDQAQTSPLPVILKDIEAAMAETIKDYKYESHFKFLHEIVKNGASFKRQRKRYLDDLVTIVDHLISEGKNDSPDW